MRPDLQGAVSGIMSNNPERSEMMIQGMHTMPSLDKEANDPQKVFAYLNTRMDYVENFFQNPNADPDSFGPPAPPGSVKVSNEDLNTFTAQATGFVAGNWDNLRTQALLKGDGKTTIATKENVDLLEQKVNRNLENQKEINGGKPENGQGQAIDPDKLVKAGVKGAVMGFFKGGKAGAIKGAITGVAGEIAKEYAQHKLKGNQNANSEPSAQESSGPQMS